MTPGASPYGPVPAALHRTAPELARRACVALALVAPVLPVITMPPVSASDVTGPLIAALQATVPGVAGLAGTDGPAWPPAPAEPAGPPAGTWRPPAPPCGAAGESCPRRVTSQPAPASPAAAAATMPVRATRRDSRAGRPRTTGAGSGAGTSSVGP